MKTLASLLLLLAATVSGVHAQTLTRGVWTQVTAASLYSGLWVATTGSQFLDGTALTVGVPMGHSVGGGVSINYETMYNFAGGGAFDSTRQRWVYCCSSGDTSLFTNEVVEIDVLTGVWNPDGQPMPPTVGLLEQIRTNWPNDGHAAGNLTAPRYLIDIDNLYPDHVTASDSGGIKAYPNSRQTYGCQVYMPSVQKFFMLGGFGNWGGSMGTANVIFEWTPATKRWQLIDSEGLISDPNQVSCAWDPDQQRVLVSSGHQLRAYNPVGSTPRMSVLLVDDFTSENDPGHIFYDTVRHRAVKFGINGNNMHGRYYNFDGSGAVIGGVNHPFDLVGDVASYPHDDGPTVFHDPVIDKYVYFRGTQTLTFFDPVTFHGTDQTFGGATPEGPDWATSKGGYHRWFYNAANDTYYAAAMRVTGAGLFALPPVRGSTPGLSGAARLTGGAKLQ